MTNYLSFREFRLQARCRLPRGLFDYIDRGIGEEAGIAALGVRLDSAQIMPRVLGSNPSRDISARVLGRDLGVPIILAPTALAGLVRPGGEIAMARAAARHGMVTCLAMQSITSIEEVRRKAPEAELWMQLYLWQDRHLSASLLTRAWEADIRVLVLTVDTPYGARKEWVLKSGFDMPLRPNLRLLMDLACHPAWSVGMLVETLRSRQLPRLANYPAELAPTLLGGPKDPRILLRNPMTWEDVTWLREAWKGKLVLKGILSTDDAVRAAESGADGIVVSSHGGRNLDAAPAPIDVLPAIAQAVGARLEILADSGVRRGIDVLRYRTRGSRAVMVGKLPLWALAAGGERGLSDALSTLSQEYSEALDYVGHDESTSAL